MRIHVDILFALGGRLYRPGHCDAPDDTAKWAIAQGYARPEETPAASAAPENKAHAAAPKRAVRKNVKGEV